MNAGVPKIVSQLFIGLAFLGLLLLFISKGMFVFAALATLVPFGLMLVMQQQKIMMWALYASVLLLGVPGLSFDSISLGMFLQLATLGMFVLNMMIHAEQLSKIDFAGKVLLCFVVIIFVTANVRGFGLYKFGGNMIGGMAYVQILIGLLFYSYLRVQNFSAKKVERLFLVMVGLSAIPYIAQVGLGLSPSLMKLGQFFVFNKTRFFSSAGSLSGRYETAVNVSYLLICFGMILNAEKKRWGLALALLGVFFFLINGFRRYTVLSALILAGNYVLLSRNRIASFFLCCAMAIGGVGLIYLVAPSLSENMQRAISFLPGIKVDAAALKDATGSTEWRLEIWEHAFADMHQYWLLGRGLLNSIQETMYQLSYIAQRGFADPLYVYMTHNYHSGFLELLVDFGVFGLSAFLLFCGSFLCKVGRQVLRCNDQSRLWRIMTVLWMVCVALVGDYLLFRGEFKAFVPTMLLFFGLLSLAYRAHRERSIALLQECK